MIAWGHNKPIAILPFDDQARFLSFEKYKHIPEVLNDINLEQDI